MSARCACSARNFSHYSQFCNLRDLMLAVIELSLYRHRNCVVGPDAFFRLSFPSLASIPMSKPVFSRACAIANSSWLRLRSRRFFQGHRLGHRKISWASTQIPVTGPRSPPASPCRSSVAVTFKTRLSRAVRSMPSRRKQPGSDNSSNCCLCLMQIDVSRQDTSIEDAVTFSRMAFCLEQLISLHAIPVISLISVSDCFKFNRDYTLSEHFGDSQRTVNHAHRLAGRERRRSDSLKSL